MGPENRRSGRPESRVEPIQAADLERKASEPRARAADLRNYLQGLESDQGELNDFEQAMAERFAARIDRRGNGANARGYIIALNMLTADAARGIDGNTSEPLPPELSGRSETDIREFEYKMIRLTQQAFGDEFADALGQAYDEFEVYEAMMRERGGEE